MPRYNTPIVLTPQDEARFWAKVDRSPGQGPHGQCWEWAGRRIRAYGCISLRHRTMLSHRVSYVLANGAIPDGLCVCHQCDNPPCCNPAHLFLGTVSDNVADRDAKGRQRSPRGESHHAAKLSRHDVIAIRDMYAAGGITQSQIGELFGVSQTIVSDIVRRKWWAHV